MTNNSKILLTDDEPEELRSCGALLQNEGYTVVTATGGREAMDALQHEAFDLLLLDLNMPEVDGHQVMEFINERGISVLTVVISGESSFEWVSRAFRLGAFDYLRKPFEFEALLHTLRNALRKRELEDDYNRLRRQLERSERLHRFMIESSPDIIFIVDKDGNFAYVNNRARDLLGYRKDELEGRHFSCIVDPESMENARYCFTERRTGDRATRDVEIWLTCKPGNLHKYFGQDKIAVELNAMGVYEHGEGPREGDGDAGDFSGTYVVGRDITERLANQKLIQYQAYHDLLTSLPNRALFMDRLNMAINTARREQRALTLMFLDLDRFKIINDTLGHSVGDQLLQGLAQRLKSCLRDSDTLARIGGDEFIVLLPDVETDDVAQTVANKIVETVKEPFVLEGNEIFITASIGISQFPRDGDNADTLIRNSDMAMYHTKEQGKNGYNLYEGDMSVRQHKLLTIETDIRRGIKEGQFQVYYQPQYHAVSGEIAGLEALLRWNHPEKGLLSPAYFLHVAEDSGLIVELGDWVLDTALADIRAWHDAGIPVYHLAVNYSLSQIEQKDFVDKIVSALKRHRLPGELLEIEITESTLTSDIDQIVAKLRQLNNVGVRVAIDDFGTGYSSLSLLQKLPINRLKIDRSFIQDMTEDSDRSIIEAIAHMARGLKLDMVAEGVEQTAQREYLMELDCAVIQGFLFSRGLPAEEARDLLSDAAVVQKGEDDTEDGSEHRRKKLKLFA